MLCNNTLTLLKQMMSYGLELCGLSFVRHFILLFLSFASAGLSARRRFFGRRAASRGPGLAVRVIIIIITSIIITIIIIIIISSSSRAQALRTLPLRAERCDAMRCDATRRDATRRDATRRDATRRDAMHASYAI